MNYSEVDILNFVEGHLDDDQTAAFLAEQRNNPDLAEAVKAMQASQLPISQAYHQQRLPPIPAALSDQLAHMASQTTPANHSVNTEKNQNDPEVTHKDASSNQIVKHPSEGRIGKLTTMGLVASLISGVCIGALTMQHYLNDDGTRSADIERPEALLDTTSKHARLVKRIADYQSLYVENTVANLSESRVNDAQLLLGSIEVHENAELRIPDLSSFGYQFARAQELGFEGRTLVQLVYRRPGSAPLALCFMPDNETSALPLTTSKHHSLNAASWVTDNQHYVLVADESNAVLEKMYATASNMIQTTPVTPVRQ